MVEAVQFRKAMELVLDPHSDDSQLEGGSVLTSDSARIRNLVHLRH